MTANGNHPICVWLTRHEPTDAQRRALRDFTIVHISGYFSRADDAWSAIRFLLDGKQPSLIVAVLPKAELAWLAQYADPTPVVRAVMEARHDGSWRWLGEWQQVLGTRLLIRPFSPTEVL